MKSSGRFSVALVIAILYLLATALGQAAESPPSIIFDTDMGGDCDDVGALFLLHGAVERGEANLLATIGCVSSDSIAPAIDAINIWFGRSQIPVGTLKDAQFLGGDSFTDEITKRYPHQFPSSQEYPDALTIYRQILTKQPDASVVIVAVGPLRNLANLLKSPPDSTSSLDGSGLVAKKVKRLEVMGGNYPPHVRQDQKEGEYNFAKDAKSAALICQSWPTPILFNGEGGSTNSGRRVTFEMPEHNPLTMAYAAYPAVGFAGDRLSWDPVSCLVAVRGAAPWYEIVEGGTNIVDEKTGINAWSEATNRKHSYLVLKKGGKNEVEQALEDFMVSGRGRPTQVNFNTTYYSKAGMCQITSQAAADHGSSAIQAFDGDDKTAWQDKNQNSWIQCQYVDGRKYLVDSIAMVCRDPERLPRTLELLGSNDAGATWTTLTVQPKLVFGSESKRLEINVPKPAKWNMYRLKLQADDKTAGIQISTIELNQIVDCRNEIPVAKLSLDQIAVRLPAHGRITLNATTLPANTTQREVAWSSNDAEVAEVRRIGEQIAMVVTKRSGKCVITATIDKVAQTCAVEVLPTSLPNDWSFTELNKPAIPGSIIVTKGEFALTGCGHGMTSWWERVRDQGVFVNQSLDKEGEISARLVSLGPNVGGPSQSWDNRPHSSAGLMIRESLDEKCGRFFLLQVDATGNLACLWRDKTGDQDDNQRKSLGKVTLPIYLKIKLQGGKATVYTSVDGQSWQEPLLTHASTFGDHARMGLTVCSGNTFASTTAVFAHVKVAP